MYQSGIKFSKVAAVRTRTERCCTAWHIEGAYDTLVEVEGSPWVEEIRADTQEMWRNKWQMHHYLIYLDSVGCFEVLAGSWAAMKGNHMFNTIINRSHRSLARVELTDEQIKAQAPSVFANAPQAGVSERYTFLPTSQIVTRLRGEGWAPVEVQQQSVRLEGRMGFQKHLIRFQRRDQIAKPGDFTPEIALVNSHDRSSA